MIFKTINSSVDETRKTLALFNKDWNTYKRNWQNANGVFGKIGSVFTPANAITKSDIEAIKAYNSQIDSCVTSQTAFNRTMLNASPAAQNLVASYNGGKVSAQGMATAQNAAKSSTIGLTIAQTALNAAIGMGIGLLISLVVKGIDKLVHANEEAIEKAEELRRKYEEFKSTNESNVTTLNGLKKEFEELSKGVSQYGDNISLTTEQYERYKEIIQQIVGMSPSLAEGYSTENGYIADKNGLLERAIELQEQEYRNELRKITNLDNLKTSMSGYIAEYKEAFNGGLVTDDMSAISTTTATDLSNALYDVFNLGGSGKHNYDNTEKIARKIIESLGIEDVNSEIQKFVNKNGNFESSWFFKAYADAIAENIEVITDSLSADIVGLDDTVFDQNIEKVDSAAQSYLDMKDAISIANESIQRDLGYIAEYADGYSNLTTEQQKFVNEFLKGYDISDIMSESNNPFDQGWKFDEDKMASVKSQITKFVEALSQDETTKTAFADLYAIPTDEQSISEFIEQFRNALEIIKAYCQENGIEIPIAITDSEQTINDLETQYQRAVDFAKDNFAGYDPTDFFKEHSINTQEEIDAWQEIAQGARDAAEAEKEYIQGSTLNIENPISFNMDTYKDQIDKAQEEITKLADSLVKLESGDLSSSDLLDLIQEFPVLAEETDNLSDALEDLANDKLESLVTSLQTAGASDELINLVRSMAAEAMNSASGIDSLNSSIDSLQSAYETLSDAVKEYNSTGTLSLDTLQTLLSLEPQYLNCLMTENGQLQLNTETLAMLTNKRLDNAEAQVVQNTIEQINTLTEQANAEAKDQNAISTDNARINTENYTMSLSNMATEAIVAAGAVSELNTALDGAKTAGVSQKDIDSVLGGMEVQLKAINSYRKNLSAGSVGSVLGSSKKSGSSKKEEDKWLEEYKKKLKELQNQLDKGLINEREFFLQSEILLNTYLKDSKEHMEKYADEISDAEKTLHSDLVNAYKYEADEYARLRDGNYLNMVEYYQSMMNLQDEYYNSEALKLKNLADTMEAQYGRMNHINLTRPSVDASAIQEAGYATELNSSSVYAQSFGNEIKQVIVTPVLPDGTVLSPESLTDYADKLLKGEQIDADIELAVFDGEDAVRQAAEYVNGLENIQAEYIRLKNTLSESPYGDFTDEQLEALEQLTEEIEKHKSQLSSELGEIKSAYDSLIEIRDTYNKYGKISINQYQSLCDMGFQYLALLSNENGALSLDENAFQRLTDAKIRQIQVDMALQATDLIKNIQTEEQAVQYLASSYDNLADSALGAAEKMLYAAKANAELLYGVNSLQAQAAATIVKGYENSKLLSGITSDTGSGSGRSNVDLKMESGGGYKKESEEVIDFFEQRVKILDNALSRLKTNLDNVAGSFAKNNLIDAELGITEEKFKNYSDALNMYTQKADEALSKLPADIAAKVKDGAVDLTTFIGDGNKEVTEAVKDYEQWADKVADCKQELAELRTAIRQLELEKFNNIMEDFTNQFDLHGDGKDLISKQIDLLKEAGQLIGESFFITQIDQSKKQLAILEDEKVQLVNQMSSAIGSGRVD